MYKRQASAEVVSTKSSSLNFRCYWNGDLQDELLDGAEMTRWNGSSMVSVINFANYDNSTSCNSTKKTPNLTADLLGDWREEIILWDSSDGCTLNIFTTNIPTEYAIPTLMHDHTYRMGVAWQNSSYNQPPHVGYYLPDYAEYLKNLSTGINTVHNDSSDNSDAIYTLQGIRSNGKKSGVYVKSGRIHFIDTK